MRTQYGFTAAALLAAAFAGVGAANAAAVDVSSGFDQASDYGAGATVVIHSGAAPTSFTVADDAPGVAFQTVRTSGGIATMSILSSATYNPSTQGAIVDIDWSATVEDTGSTLNLIPFLSQGGVLYRYLGGDITGAASFTNGSGFTGVGTGTQGFVDAVAADFEALSTTDTTFANPPYGPTTVPGSNPDFSASGGEILLGYLSVQDSGGARTNDATLSNHSVVINNIPEPGSLALIGLGGLAILRRRRG